MPLIIEGPEKLLLAKVKFAEMGISPREFRKSRLSDIKDIIEIKNAISEKKQREREVREKMENIRWK